MQHARHRHGARSGASQCLFFRARAVVVAVPRARGICRPHGRTHTCFGAITRKLSGQRTLTSFEKGINGFTWLMIRFMVVMVSAVFLINTFSKGNWVEALLFSLAVALGLTPEMLPMIVTVNLSKGALAMSKKKVIVKRLNSIQNFGAMDTLCTDKTWARSRKIKWCSSAMSM